MANNKIKQLNVNGTSYDIKDELLGKVITDTTIGASTTADTIKTELTKAIEGSSSTNKKTLKQILADLKTKIEWKVDDVTWDATNKQLNQTKEGSSSPIVTAAQLIAGLHYTSGTANSGFLYESEIDSKISTAITGSASFRGLIQQGEAWPPAVVEGKAFKGGDYWIVKDAGTYYNKYLEAGDQVFAIKDDNSSRTSSNIWDYFNVVQANIDPSIYAKLDGGSDALNPQTYTGQHLFDSNSAVAFNGEAYAQTVATVSNNQLIATTAFVKNAIAAADNDKIKDYDFITADLGSVSTYGTTTLASNIYSSIAAAYTANKVPVVALTLSFLTGACPIVMTKYQATATEYHGSAYITEAGQKILVGIHSTSQSTQVTLTKAVTGVNVTKDNVATYSNEVITFISDQVLTGATLS